ncbi:MAG: hypothetical protein WCR21_11190 [Bacteroidota bacterium]
MKSLSLVILLIFVSFTSCKKNNTSANPGNISEACECSSSHHDPIPNDYRNCSGFLGYYHHQFIQNDTSTSHLYIVDATFNNAPNYYPNGHLVSVNAVSINNLNLDVNQDQYNVYYNYEKGNGAFYNMGLLWNVDGANGIPSFNYLWNQAEPSANIMGLPYVISKSNPRNFPVNLVTGNGGSISIEIYNAPLTHEFNAPLYKGNNCICISSENLKDFGTGSATIIIWLFDTVTINVNGQNFKFNKTIKYYKSIKMID